MSEVKKWISNKWMTLKGTECSLAGRTCTIYKVSRTRENMTSGIPRTNLEKASAFGEV